MIRIACTALSKRIIAGRVTKDGLAFTDGKKEDVTSDCLKAVIEFIGLDTHVVTVNGKPMFEITVSAVEEVKP